MTANPYRNPEVAAWMGSFEGVPDHPAAGAADWRGRGREALSWLGVGMPGFMLALALAGAASVAAQWVGERLLGYDTSPISPVLFAVLAGIAIRNTIGVPDVYQSGVRLCLKVVLQVGIVLLGIRLSLSEAVQLGAAGLPVVIASIATALVLVSWISRMAGLSPRLGSLIGVGTSICGVSAIMATAPVIDAEDDEVAYAVASVTLFGVLALLAYPFLADVVFEGDAHQAGLFLGAAIHDTSQAAGAGMSYQQQYDAPEAFNAAVVTKLVRNLFLVGVLPLLGVLHHRRTAVRASLPVWYRLVPMFVLGFLAMTLLRTIGDIGDQPFAALEPATWQGLVKRVEALSSWCLMVAMAAVGLSTSLHRLKHLGLRPLVVALMATLAVGSVAALLTSVSL